MHVFCKLIYSIICNNRFNLFRFIFCFIFMQIEYIFKK